jgi:hypothetical protein
MDHVNASTGHSEAGIPARPEHRAPEEMDSWELIACYRHARALASFTPSAQLARALANFLSLAQKELEARDEWRPDYLLSA